METPPGGQRSTACLLTGPAPAAIAVIRLLGPEVARFLAAHFTGKAPPRRSVHGELRDGKRLIDDPLVVLLYDDAAELHLHGGPWVVRSALNLLARAGFSIVDARADASGEVFVEENSPLRREVLAALGAARTQLALRVLLAQFDAWEEFVRRSPGREEICEVLNDATLGRLLRAPVVAIAGLPNVGKSTLANQLFGSERSITADMPGTTRDWVGEIANINGLAVMLVDTPGVGHSDDAIEQAAIARGSRKVAEADLVVEVIDAGDGAGDGAGKDTTSALAISGPLSRPRPRIIVANKIDRLAAGRALDREALPTVATTGAGVEAVRVAITRHFQCDAIDPRRPRWWTVRQQAIITSALNNPKALRRIIECRA